MVVVAAVSASQPDEDNEQGSECPSSLLTCRMLSYASTLGASRVASMSSRRACEPPAATLRTNAHVRQIARVSEKPHFEACAFSEELARPELSEERADVLEGSR